MSTKGTQTKKTYRPPYRITPAILGRIEKIGEALGALTVIASGSTRPDLHRINRIKTIQGTLEIEGNTLNLDQVTALLDGKKVLAQPRELQEARNAFAAYDAMPEWTPHSGEDLLTAHRLMMAGLMDEMGRFRSSSVGVGSAEGVLHVAPPANRVPASMRQLLQWLKQTDEHPLIAGSVFHYELEFIHPFQDGNGRMGRLWQTLILSQWKPVFSVLPLESMIRDHRAGYYEALNSCNQAGESTEFIAFVLKMIETVIAGYLRTEQKSGLDDKLDVKLDEKLSKRRVAIIRLMKRDPGITVTRIGEKIGISRTAVDKNIQLLKQKGWVKRIGPAKGGHWEVVKARKPGNG